MIPDVVVAFKQFVHIVQRLRKECPWDGEQTHDSVKHLLIEEAYETVDAIESGDMEDLKKELGDLFLHVVFHSVMAAEEDNFTLQDVIETETEKLIRRHPHVFARTKVAGTREVLANWERIKLEEGEKRSVLSGIASNLPALLLAQRIQEKVSGVGFDFPGSEEAWEKVTEELGELESLVEADANRESLEDELGDVLFALVNYARFLDINPENALRRTNKKFERRFTHIETTLQQTGRSFDQVSLAEMDEIWEEAKERERNL